MSLIDDRRVTIPLVVVIAVLVAVVDFATGDRLALSFFYMLPVIAMTKLAGTKGGLALSFLCAIAFPLTDILAGTRLDLGVAFWNFTVRAATLCTVAILVDRLNLALAHEKELSRTDPLTQLANTRWFREQANRELLRARRSSKPLTLLFMDLDNFKVINDDLGHGKGDELLAAVGSLLGSSTRSFDIVGRLGGDEFALMLPETDAVGSSEVVERIRRGLREILQTAGLPESVSFSIGSVTTNAPPDSLDTLVLVADQLMYSAKRAGKNQVRSKNLQSSAVHHESLWGTVPTKRVDLRLNRKPEKGKGLPV